MMIKTEQIMDVAPKEIAEALAGDPEAFANFFFAFDEEMEERCIDVLPFAKSMAGRMGARRMRPLRAICRYMDALDAGLIPQDTTEAK